MVHDWLFAVLSLKHPPPCLYDIVKQRYSSCLTVARVHCLVTREWLGSWQFLYPKGSLSV